MIILGIFTCPFVAAHELSFKTDSLGENRPANQTLDIAFVLWRGMTPAEKHFLDELKKAGYSVQHDIFNANLQDKYLSRYILKHVVPRLSHYDYVYTFGTHVSRIVHSLAKKPFNHVYVAVEYPEKVGLKTNDHILGVSNQVSYEQLLREVLEKHHFKQIAYLYYPQGDNSIFFLNQIPYLEKMFQIKISANPIYFKGLSNPIEVAKKIKRERSEAVLIPLDSYIIKNKESVMSALKQYQLFTFTTSQAIFEAGADVALMQDYARMGELAAKLVDRHYQGVLIEEPDHSALTTQIHLKYQS